MAWRKFLLIETFCFILLACNDSSNKTVSSSKDSLNITAGTAVNKTNNILDYLSNAKEYSLFVELLNKSGMSETLTKPGPFTVFAPTNKAFEKISANVLANWRKQGDGTLVNFLSDHIVAGALEIKDLSKLKRLNTLSGEKINVEMKNNKILINKKLVAEGSFTCTNGVVYISDETIVPAKAQ